MLLEEDGKEKEVQCTLNTEGNLRCGSYDKDSTITVLGVRINTTSFYSVNESFKFNINENNSNLFLFATEKGIEEYKICEKFDSTCDAKITSSSGSGSTTGGTVKPGGGGSTSTTG